MKSIIEGIFDFLAMFFDKIPVLNKYKGWRSVFGFIGLAATATLQNLGKLPTEIASALYAGFSAFSMLALNSKGRSKKEGE